MWPWYLCTVSLRSDLARHPAMAPIVEVRNRTRAEVRLRSILRDNAGPRYQTVKSGEPAPESVVAATALMSWGQLEGKANRSRFMWSGKKALGELVSVGVEAGLDLANATSAFELGCGGARLIRHLRRVEGLQLVGSDALESNIDWCRANVSGITFHCNELEPPLAFADDNTFDFVFAYSVFSHIPMHLQQRWIGEFARILKPGGVAAVTVLGPKAARVMMNDDDLARFEADGEFTMDADHPDVSASSAHIGSWDVFMSEERLRELYGEVLEVVSYGSGFQTPVGLRKPL